jgi:hypothetical protein
MSVFRYSTDQMKREKWHRSFCWRRKVVRETSLYVFASRERAQRMCVSGVKLSESRMVCRGRKRIQTRPAPEEVYWSAATPPASHLPHPPCCTCKTTPQCHTKHARSSPQFLFRTLAHKAVSVFFLSASRRGSEKTAASFLARKRTLSASEPASAGFCAGVGHVALLGVKPTPLASLSLTRHAGLMKLFSTSLLLLSGEIGCHFPPGPRRSFFY